MYGELNFNPAYLMDGLIYIAIPFTFAFIITAIIIHSLIALKNKNTEKEETETC